MSATEIIHAIDIGSGTGFLGMLAAKALHTAFGNHNCKIQVTSMEMASCMTQIARRTIRDNDKNGLSIHVLEGHSTELPPATPPRAQLCVSELLESGLLGEGILPALRDAWERHLQVHTDEEENDGDDAENTSAIMIPQRARVYAQIVQSGRGRNHRNKPGDNKSDENWISNYYGPHNDRIAQTFHRYHHQVQQQQNTPKTPTPPDSSPPPRFSLDTEGSQLLLDAQHAVIPVHADGKLLRERSLVALTDPFQVLGLGFYESTEYSHSTS